MKLGSRFLLAAALLPACGGDDACDPDAPNSICTIVGTGEQGYSGDEGAATDATLYIPQDAAIGPDGQLWFIDFNNYVVRSVDDQGVIHTRVGSGVLDDSPPAGQATMPALEAGFNHTTDLFFYDGYLYLSAWHNSRVKRVELSSMLLENYAGAGVRTKYTGDDGPALDAAVDLPSAIALDPNNNIVLMDQANQIIRRVDAADRTIHRVAGRCVVETDVQCADGVDPVACPAPNDKVVCGDPTTECAKPCTPSYGGDDGPALELRMAQPYGQSAPPAGRITYDTAGNLIFADTDNNRLRKVDASGIVTTIAGTGEAGFSGDGGPAASAQINGPVDVESAPDGSIYFTDTYNNCVRKIDPAGTITTVVGVCSANPLDRMFAGDGGPPTEAKLDRPAGIELAGNKIYVCDSYNNRVRVVNL